MRYHLISSLIPPSNFDPVDEAALALSRTWLGTTKWPTTEAEPNAATEIGALSGFVDEEVVEEEDNTGDVSRE